MISFKEQILNSFLELRKQYFPPIMETFFNLISSNFFPLCILLFICYIVCKLSSLLFHYFKYKAAILSTSVALCVQITVSVCSHTSDFGYNSKCSPILIGTSNSCPVVTNPTETLLEFPS